MPSHNSLKTVGLKKHLKTMGKDYNEFVKIAEANYDKFGDRFIGVRSMARIFGVSNQTMAKWLEVYKSER